MVTQLTNGLKIKLNMEIANEQIYYELYKSIYLKHFIFRFTSMAN